MPQGVRKTRPWPELRAEDTWLLKLWDEMTGRLGQGSAVDILRFRCEVAGLARAVTLEAWERVSLIETTAQNYWHAMAEARAKARGR